MRALLHGSQLAGHKGLVVGADNSGVAAAKLLGALGADVSLLDRDPAALDPACRQDLAGRRVEVLLGPHKPEHFRGANLVVLSPGRPEAEMAGFLAQCPDAQVVSELELASWFVSEPVVAVTGSHGKAVTAALIGEILAKSGKRAFVGGNAAGPLSGYLLSGRQAEVIVLEVSSSQLRNVHSFKPQVGVLVNFSAEQIDDPADLAQYLAAKLKLFAKMDAKGLAVVPLEMKDLLEARNFTKASRVYFTPSNRFKENHLPGEHEKANMEAAWLACRALGINEDQARAAVAGFKPSPQALEPAEAKKSCDKPVRLVAGTKVKQ